MAGRYTIALPDGVDLARAIGVQRLSQLPPERASAVLERALAMGVAWVDAADVYGRAPGDAERWLRPFSARVHVATKGGLVRDGARWRPDGRAGHLARACEASALRLGVDAVALYLLHAPDPRTPFGATARALRKLLDRGLVRQVGLCNVTTGQLEQALDEVPVACVQVEVSRTWPGAVRSGILEACGARGIPVWAYRPLGGVDKVPKVLADPAVRAVADKHGVDASTVVLAWTADLGLLPLPGPTREQTVDACVAAWSLALDDDDRGMLDAGSEAARQLRRPRAERAPPQDASGEVRIVMGTPGAGKTTRVLPLDGWARLNRDARGGRLGDLVPALDGLLATGQRHVVLDNTYASRASRNPVVEAAWAHGVPVTCEWLDTSDDDAEVNLVLRALDALGRLPEPHELERPEAGLVPPRALHRYRAEFEPPSEGEGFLRLERVPFARRAWPGTREAWLLDGADLRQEHAEELRALGAVVLVAAWAPGAERAAAVASLEAKAQALGLEVHAAACVHPAGPPVCWCRKPLPGLAVDLFRRHGCDPTRSTAWGGSAADRAVARKLGMRVRERQG